MQGVNRLHRAAFAFLVLLFSGASLAQEIDGVQPAAIDQPRVNVLVRRTATGAPLMASSAGQSTFNIEAFLDTGAGSSLLSTNTAKELGVTREALASTSEARFEDVGVGGTSEFAISENLFLSIAPNTPSVDTDNKDTYSAVYNLTVGPFRTEIGPLGTEAGLMAMLTGDMDIVGMPAMRGKIVVLDCKDANNFEDKIRTYVYDAANQARAFPPIPKTTRHVQLSYADFKSFTHTSPGAEPPAIAANPIIGPNPLGAAGTKVPPMRVVHNGRATEGSWLLDTGAVTSMISRKQAAALGITYKPGTEDSGSPQLDGYPADKQFTLDVSGIGGMSKAAGFYADKLIVPTREGTPITFLHAPMLVADITVKDANGKTVTLDGVFGMNYMVASAKLSEGILPDISSMSAGPFRYIVFDQPAGILAFD